MAQMYESGLFTELGDLLGHDPTFYEEPDVSSYGDITKHSYSTSSLYNVMTTAKVLEPLSPTAVSSDTTEIDCLLSEGNMLLDQLMAENGLDLLTEPVELADVDELVASEAKFNNVVFDSNPVSDLFAQFYEPTDELHQQIPESPVSTLPSEPSSPVDLFELATSITSEPTVAESSTAVTAGDELDDLLSSLLDEGHAPQSSSNCFDDQLVSSPASISGSDCSYYGNGSEYSNDWEEDNSSSSYSYSPAPEKVKTPKKKKSSTPYSKLPTGRKEKKKLQNKEAAIRYRQKKRGETQVLADEEALLQERNDSLKAEVLNLEREIMCMKELLSDVFNIHSI